MISGRSCEGGEQLDRGGILLDSGFRWGQERRSAVSE